jgi:hypothetical protein
MKYMIRFLLICVFIGFGCSAANAGDNVTKQARLVYTGAEDVGDGEYTWVACGPNDGKCRVAPNVPADKIVMVRYGQSNDANFGYLYTVFSGIQDPICNDRMGDPNDGLPGKECHYNTDNMYGLEAGDGSGQWTLCGTEGIYCHPDKAGFQWMRYGAPAEGDETNGRWFYALVSEGQSIRCNNEEVTNGYDPAPGRAKRCELGPVVPHTSDASLDTCATERSTCNTGTYGLVVARFGADHVDGGKWKTRLAQLSSFNCSASSKSIFNRDPVAHYEKQCDVLELISPAIVVQAQWQKVASCHNGCPIEYAVQYGTERTDTKTTGSEYENTLTAGVEVQQGWEIGAGEGHVKVSFEYACRWLRSVENSAAITHSMSTTAVAECGDKDGQDYDYRELYQFTLAMYDSCIGQGKCEGETYSRDFICVYDPPSGYEGPRCMPGRCANDLCTECEEQSDLELVSNSTPVGKRTCK